MTYTFQPAQAHKYSVFSNPNGLLWGVYSTGVATSGKVSKVMADKRDSIIDFQRLIDQGVVTLGKKVVIVAEGCDDGNYFPLLKSALSSHLKDAEVAIFTTDISERMANKVAAPAAFDAFGKDALYYSGRCNAYEGPPSELKQFQDWQKLFFPFRMGIVGCREEIANYLKQRKALLEVGGGGVIILHALQPTKKNEESIVKELTKGKDCDLEKVDGWKITSQDQQSIDLIRTVPKGFMESFRKQVEKGHASKLLDDEARARIECSIRESSPGNRNAIAFASMFTKQGVEDLVRNEGFVSFGGPGTSVGCDTDSGHPLDLWRTIFRVAPKSVPPS